MCTSIAAGNKATADGIVLLSRNEDFTRNNWNKYLVYRDKPEYKCGDPNIVNSGHWTLGNGLTVPLPEKSYCYSAIPDCAAYIEASIAINDRYFFEERGINEKNVAISATNSLTINEKANAADPLLRAGGIAESIITTLILPQVDTAIEAVELLGQYVEKSGASEVNGVLFGDTSEVWYFENGSAHHWIAVKIPQDSYLVVANGMRVHGVDLDDCENVRHSSGLYEFIIENQLLEKPDKNNLNFAEAFGIPGVPYNEDRIWLAQKKLTPSRQQDTGLNQYPLFLKPDTPMAVKDIMGVLRATYKGTALEGKAKRPIGYEKTAESHIIVLDPAMPYELQGIIWQSISTPMGSPYMPLFNTMNAIPPGYTIGSNQYGPMSAYWAFRGLYALASSKPLEYLPVIQRLWEKYEQSCLSEQEHLKTMLREMYGSDTSTAIEFTRRYSTGIAYETVGLANDTRNELMTAMTVAE